MRPQRLGDRAAAQHAPPHAAADSLQAGAARILAGALLTPQPKPRTRTAAAKSEPAGVWLFDPQGGRIAVKNAEAVLAQLPVFLAGWPFAWDHPADAAPCEIEVSVQRDAIAVARSGAGGTTQRFGSTLEAANGLAGALVSALIARDERTVCLHASAVMIGKGLALFIGDTGTGKSSIALDLTVRGHRLFGDDRIGVRLADVGTGICLGLMPKARLPLPRTADHRLHAFIEAFSAAQTEDIAYLRPPAEVMAAFGDIAPLAAMFLLERRTSGATRVAPAARPAIVAAVVQHSFAPHIPANALIGRAAGLAAAVPGYRLGFSDSRDAAAAVAATVAAP